MARRRGWLGRLGNIFPLLLYLWGKTVEVFAEGVGVKGGIYYYRGSSPWQMGFHLFNLCWSVPVKRINKPSVFLRPPQNQRLNYLKANWVLKWAICQWEAHWFNLPCGFTPDATGAPLCAYRKRGDRYTYPSLNLSSKRAVMGCLCAYSCCHVTTHSRVPPHCLHIHAPHTNLWNTSEKER